MNTISGLSLLHTHMEGLIANTHANAYWKDETGTYLGANDWTVTRCAMKSHDNLVGATDRDLVSEEVANVVTYNDLHVMKQQQMTMFIEPVKLLADSADTNHAKRCLSYKSPLLNLNGKTIGVFGLSYWLNDDAPGSQIIDEISLIAGKQGVMVAKQLLAQHQQSTFNLTARQLDCLAHLAKGKTVKQIATSLSLSHRTVEHYLETIKSKLGCASRAELFEKMIELGLI